MDYQKEKKAAADFWKSYFSKFSPRGANSNAASVAPSLEENKANASPFAVPADYALKPQLESARTDTSTPSTSGQASGGAKGS